MLHVEITVTGSMTANPWHVSLAISENQVNHYEYLRYLLIEAVHKFPSELVSTMNPRFISMVQEDILGFYNDYIAIKDSTPTSDHDCSNCPVSHLLPPD
jgi:hypothetical protein